MVGIVLSWVISPFLGATIAFLVFTQSRRCILTACEFLCNAKCWAPFWLAMTVSLVLLSFFLKMPLGRSLGLGVSGALAVTACIAAAIWLAGYWIVGRILQGVEHGPESMEELFRRMQVGTACYMAMSLGANDVANAVGPVAAIWMIATSGELTARADVPIWMLVVGGFGIAAGIMALGRRVMSMVGERITLLSNTRGFSVEFGAATTVLAASNLGMPVSSTHATVGAVVGVGLARGFAAVDFRVLGKIVTSERKIQGRSASNSRFGLVFSFPRGCKRHGPMFLVSPVPTCARRNPASAGWRPRPCSGRAPGPGFRSPRFPGPWPARPVR